MAKSKYRSGTEIAEIEMLPAHFIAKSLDIFLISDEPNKLIEAIIFLNIGIETYIKSSLEEKEPNLIHRLDSNRWKSIKENGEFLSLDKKKEKRTYIGNYVNNKTDLKNNKTLDYGIALEIFPIYFSINKKTLDDLNDMKEYRNGLFHWKAKDESGFKLSKRLIRLFEWFFKHIEKHNGGWLGRKFFFIDPNGRKRTKLKELKKFNKNEQLLALVRRVNKHQAFYKEISLVSARKNGDVFIPSALEWKEQSCIACNQNTLEIHFSGTEKGKQYFLECKTCDFHCTGSEFDLLKTGNFPTLEKIAEDLKNKST